MRVFKIDLFSTGWENDRYGTLKCVLAVNHLQPGVGNYIFIYFGVYWEGQNLKSQIVHRTIIENY